MTKQELRKHIRMLKEQYLTGEQSSCEVLLLEKLSPYKVIMLYSALPDEVPTQKLIDELVAQGKTILLPRVINDTDMELHRYTGKQDLQTGAYGMQVRMPWHKLGKRVDNCYNRLAELFLFHTCSHP